MRSALRIAAAVSLALLSACGGGADGPVPVDTRNDACAWCRMSVSDLRYAAQLTAPGHEPKLFDDAGCLRDWLKEPREAAAWTAWLSDHRTKEWVRATDAVLVRDPAVQTPMTPGSSPGRTPPRASRTRRARAARPFRSPRSSVPSRRGRSERLPLRPLRPAGAPSRDPLALDPDLRRRLRGSRSPWPSPVRPLGRARRPGLRAHFGLPRPARPPPRPLSSLLIGVLRWRRNEARPSSSSRSRCRGRRSSSGRRPGSGPR
jgi:NosL.